MKVATSGLSNDVNQALYQLLQNEAAKDWQDDDVDPSVGVGASV